MKIRAVCLHPWRTLTPCFICTWWIGWLRISCANDQSARQNEAKCKWAFLSSMQRCSWECRKTKYFFFWLILGFESAIFFAYPWRVGLTALCERKKSDYENPLQKFLDFLCSRGFESPTSFANRQRDISGIPQWKEAKKTAGSARKNACTIRHAYECEVNQWNVSKNFLAGSDGIWKKSTEDEQRSPAPQTACQPAQAPNTPTPGWLTRKR